MTPLGHFDPKDPTNSLKVMITLAHAHSTHASCIVHNSSLYFLPHTIHGLFLSQIFIENERVKNGEMGHLDPKELMGLNDPTNFHFSFAWSPCSRSMLVAWMWKDYLIHFLLSSHTVWCDCDRWVRERGSKAPDWVIGSNWPNCLFLFVWSPCSRWMCVVWMWMDCLI